MCLVGPLSFVCTLLIHVLQHSPERCLCAAWTDWAIEGTGHGESLINHLGPPLCALHECHV